MEMRLGNVRSIGGVDGMESWKMKIQARCGNRESLELEVEEEGEWD